MKAKPISFGFIVAIGMLSYVATTKAAHTVTANGLHPTSSQKLARLDADSVTSFSFSTSFDNSSSASSSTGHDVNFATD